jgi:flagellar biogenesis protein FliO
MLIFAAVQGPTWSLPSDTLAENQEAFGMGSRMVSPEPAALPALEPVPAAKVSKQTNHSAPPAKRQVPIKGSGTSQMSSMSVTELPSRPPKAHVGASRPAVSSAAPGNVMARPIGRPDKVALLATLKDEPEKVPARREVTAKAVLYMIVKMAFVLALAYVTILVLKWVSNRSQPVSQSSQNLRVLDTIRLSQNSALHLISAKGRLLLVGCSPGQVNLLQELNSADASDSTEPVNTRFAEYLAKYSQGDGNASPAARIGGLIRDCTAYLRKRHLRAGDDHES